MNHFRNPPTHFAGVTPYALASCSLCRCIDERYATGRGKGEHARTHCLTRLGADRATQTEAQMANKALEEYLRGITIHLDTISCDLEMFRIALQVLLFHLIDGGPDKSRAYHSLRHELLGAIESTVGSVLRSRDQRAANS